MKKENPIVYETWEVEYDANSNTTTKIKKLVNIDKAIRDLNHSNSIDLDEGVRRTIKWMKEYYG